MAAKIDSGMRTLIRLSAMIILLPAALHAGASVDGRVALPKSHAAPVMAQRYGVVTRGGFLGRNRRSQLFISMILSPNQLHHRPNKSPKSKK